ncbi:hypothetical protein KKG55_02850 [Candidatus Micrarchaeota archaeon]|nr:hypothetical protein [Candidatus Micrarchaeota archaeon]
MVHQRPEQPDQQRTPTPENQADAERQLSELLGYSGTIPRRITPQQESGSALEQAERQADEAVAEALGYARELQEMLLGPDTIDHEVLERELERIIPAEQRDRYEDEIELIEELVQRAVQARESGDMQTAGRLAELVVIGIEGLARIRELDARLLDSGSQNTGQINEIRDGLLASFRDVIFEGQTDAETTLHRSRANLVLRAAQMYANNAQLFQGELYGEMGRTLGQLIIDGGSAATQGIEFNAETEERVTQGLDAIEHELEGAESNARALAAAQLQQYEDRYLEMSDGVTDPGLRRALEEFRGRLERFRERLLSDDPHVETEGRTLDEELRQIDMQIDYLDYLRLRLLNGRTGAQVAGLEAVCGRGMQALLDGNLEQAQLQLFIATQYNEAHGEQGRELRVHLLEQSQGLVEGRLQSSEVLSYLSDYYSEQLAQRTTGPGRIRDEQAQQQLADIVEGLDHEITIADLVRATAALRIADEIRLQERTLSGAGNAEVREGTLRIMRRGLTLLNSNLPAVLATMQAELGRQYAHANTNVRGSIEAMSSRLVATGNGQPGTEHQQPATDTPQPASRTEPPEHGTDNQEPTITPNQAQDIETLAQQGNEYILLLQRRQQLLRLRQRAGTDRALRRVYNDALQSLDSLLADIGEGNEISYDRMRGANAQLALIFGDEGQIREAFATSRDPEERRVEYESTADFVNLGDAIRGTSRQVRNTVIDLYGRAMHELNEGNVRRGRALIALARAYALSRSAEDRTGILRLAERVMEAPTGMVSMGRVSTLPGTAEAENAEGPVLRDPTVIVGGEQAAEPQEEERERPEQPRADLSNSLARAYLDRALMQRRITDDQLRETYTAYSDLYIEAHWERDMGSVMALGPLVRLYADAAVASSEGAADDPVVRDILALETGTPPSASGNQEPETGDTEHRTTNPGQGIPSLAELQAGLAGPNGQRRLLPEILGAETPEQTQTVLQNLELSLTSLRTRFMQTQFNRSASITPTSRMESGYDGVRARAEAQRRRARTDGDSQEVARLDGQVRAVNLELTQARLESARRFFAQGTEFMLRATELRDQARSTEDQTERAIILQQAGDLEARGSMLMMQAEGLRDSTLGVHRSVVSVRSRAGRGMRRIEDARDSFDRAAELYLQAGRELSERDLDTPIGEGDRAYFESQRRAANNDYRMGNGRLQQQLGVQRAVRRVLADAESVEGQNQANVTEFQGIEIPRRASEMPEDENDYVAPQVEAAYNGRQVQRQIDEARRLARAERLDGAVRGMNSARSYMQNYRQQAYVAMLHTGLVPGATDEESEHGMAYFRTFDMLASLRAGRQAIADGNLDGAGEVLRKVNREATVGARQQRLENQARVEDSIDEEASASASGYAGYLAQRRAQASGDVAEEARASGRPADNNRAEAQEANAQLLETTGVLPGLEADARMEAGLARGRARDLRAARDAVDTTEDIPNSDTALDLVSALEELGESRGTSRNRMVPRPSTLSRDLRALRRYAEDETLTPAERDQRIMGYLSEHPDTLRSAAAVLRRNGEMTEGTEMGLVAEAEHGLGVLQYQDHAVGWNLSISAGERAVELLDQADEQHRSGARPHTVNNLRSNAGDFLSLAVTASRSPGEIPRAIAEGRYVHLARIEGADGGPLRVRRRISGAYEEVNIRFTPAAARIPDLWERATRRSLTALQSRAQGASVGLYPRNEVEELTQLDLNATFAGLGYRRSPGYDRTIPESQRWGRLVLTRGEHRLLQDAAGAVSFARAEYSQIGSLLTGTGSRDERDSAIREVSGLVQNAQNIVDTIIREAEGRTEIPIETDERRAELEERSTGLGRQFTLAAHGVELDIEHGREDELVVGQVRAAGMLALGSILCATGLGMPAGALFLEEAIRGLEEQSRMSGGYEQMTTLEQTLAISGIAMAGVGFVVGGLSGVLMQFSAEEVALTQGLRTLSALTRYTGMGMMAGGVVTGGLELAQHGRNPEAGVFDYSMTLFNMLQPFMQMGASRVMFENPHLMYGRSFGARTARLGMAVVFGESVTEMTHGTHVAQAEEAVRMRNERRANQTPEQIEAEQNVLISVELRLGRSLSLEEEMILYHIYGQQPVDMNGALALLSGEPMERIQPETRTPQPETGTPRPARPQSPESQNAYARTGRPEQEVPGPETEPGSEAQQPLARALARRIMDQYANSFDSQAMARRGDSGGLRIINAETPLARAMADYMLQQERSGTPVTRSQAARHIAEEILAGRRDVDGRLIIREPSAPQRRSERPQLAQRTAEEVLAEYDRGRQGDQNFSPEARRLEELISEHRRELEDGETDDGVEISELTLAAQVVEDVQVARGIISEARAGANNDNVFALRMYMERLNITEEQAAMRVAADIRNGELQETVAGFRQGARPEEVRPGEATAHAETSGRTGMALAQDLELNERSGLANFARALVRHEYGTETNSEVEAQFNALPPELQRAVRHLTGPDPRQETNRTSNDRQQMFVINARADRRTFNDYRTNRRRGAPVIETARGMVIEAMRAAGSEAEANDQPVQMQATGTDDVVGTVIRPDQPQNQNAEPGNRTPETGRPQLVRAQGDTPARVIPIAGFGERRPNASAGRGGSEPQSHAPQDARSRTPEPPRAVRQPEQTNATASEMQELVDAMLSGSRTGIAILNLREMAQQSQRGQLMRDAVYFLTSGAIDIGSLAPETRARMIAQMAEVIDGNAMIPLTEEQTANIARLVFGSVVGTAGRTPASYGNELVSARRFFGAADMLAFGRMMRLMREQAPGSADELVRTYGNDRTANAQEPPRVAQPQTADHEAHARTPARRGRQPETPVVENEPAHVIPLRPEPREARPPAETFDQNAALELDPEPQSAADRLALRPGFLRDNGIRVTEDIVTDAQGRTYRIYLVNSGGEQAELRVPAELRGDALAQHLETEVLTMRYMDYTTASHDQTKLDALNQYSGNNRLLRYRILALDELQQNGMLFEDAIMAVTTDNGPRLTPEVQRRLDHIYQRTVEATPHSAADLEGSGRYVYDVAEARNSPDEAQQQWARDSEAHMQQQGEPGLRAEESTVALAVLISSCNDEGEVLATARMLGRDLDTGEGEDVAPQQLWTLTILAHRIINGDENVRAQALQELQEIFITLTTSELRAFGRLYRMSETAFNEQRSTTSRQIMQEYVAHMQRRNAPTPQETGPHAQHAEPQIAGHETPNAEPETGHRTPETQPPAAVQHPVDFAPLDVALSQLTGHGPDITRYARYIFELAMRNDVEIPEAYRDAVNAVRQAAGNQQEGTHPPATLEAIEQARSILAARDEAHAPDAVSSRINMGTVRDLMALADGRLGRDATATERDFAQRLASDPEYIRALEQGDMQRAIGLAIRYAQMLETHNRILSGDAERAESAPQSQREMDFRSLGGRSITRGGETIRFAGRRGEAPQTYSVEEYNRAVAIASYAEDLINGRVEPGSITEDMRADAEALSSDVDFAAASAPNRRGVVDRREQLAIALRRVRGIDETGHRTPETSEPQDSGHETPNAEPETHEPQAATPQHAETPQDSGHETPNAEPETGHRTPEPQLVAEQKVRANPQQILGTQVRDFLQSITGQVEGLGPRDLKYDGAFDRGNERVVRFRIGDREIDIPAPEGYAEMSPDQLREYYEQQLLSQLREPEAHTEGQELWRHNIPEGAERVGGRDGSPQNVLGTGVRDLNLPREYNFGGAYRIDGEIWIAFNRGTGENRETVLVRQMQRQGNETPEQIGEYYRTQIEAAGRQEAVPQEHTPDVPQRQAHEEQVTQTWSVEDLARANAGEQGNIEDVISWARGSAESILQYSEQHGGLNDRLSGTIYGAAMRRANEHGRTSPNIDDMIFGVLLVRNVLGRCSGSNADHIRDALLTGLGTIIRETSGDMLTETIEAYTRTIIDVSTRIPTDIDNNQRLAVIQMVDMIATLYARGVNPNNIITNPTGTGLLDLYTIASPTTLHQTVVHLQRLVMGMPRNTHAEAIDATITLILEDLSRLEPHNRMQYLEAVTRFDLSPESLSRLTETNQRGRNNEGQIELTGRGRMPPSRLKRLPILAEMILAQGGDAGRLLSNLDNSIVRRQLSNGPSFEEFTRFLMNLRQAQTEPEQQLPLQRQEAIRTMRRAWLGLVREQLEYLGLDRNQRNQQGISENIDGARLSFVNDRMRHLNTLYSSAEDRRIDIVTMVDITRDLAGQVETSDFMVAIGRGYAELAPELNIPPEWAAENLDLVAEFVSYRRILELLAIHASNYHDYTGNPDAFTTARSMLDDAFRAHMEGRYSEFRYREFREELTQFATRAGLDGDALFQRWSTDETYGVHANGETYDVHETGSFDAAFFSGVVRGDTACQSPRNTHPVVGGIVGSVMQPWMRQIVIGPPGSGDATYRRWITMVRGDDGQPILLVQPRHQIPGLSQEVDDAVLSALRQRYEPLGIEVRIPGSGVYEVRDANGRPMNRGYSTFAFRAPFAYLDSNMTGFFDRQGEIIMQHGLHVAPIGGVRRFPVGSVLRIRTN